MDAPADSEKDPVIWELGDVNPMDFDNQGHHMQYDNEAFGVWALHRRDAKLNRYYLRFLDRIFKDWLVVAQRDALNMEVARITSGAKQLVHKSPKEVSFTRWFEHRGQYFALCFQFHYGEPQWEGILNGFFKDYETHVKSSLDSWGYYFRALLGW